MATSDIHMFTQSQNLTSPRRAECFSNIWSASTWLTVPLEKGWKKICGALMIVLEGLDHPQIFLSLH